MSYFAVIHWDPNPEIFTIPFLNWPILWYGVFFAAGFAVGFPIFYSILCRYLSTRPDSFDVQKRGMFLADRLTVYMVVGTVIGARVGHFLFYEHPAQYLKNPLEIFRVWEGGLASHGAAIGIILALVLFARRYKSLAEGLDWIRLLDYVCVPTALAGAFIRLGNFFNQEILGTPSNLPWAVIFAHPMDHSLPVPRHPVQLYESIFYFLVFFLLWRLTYRPSFLLAKGRLIGLFLILVFGFRFLVEYLKTEQSSLLSRASDLTMGQILSIPAILAGAIFLYTRSTSKSP